MKVKTIFTFNNEEIREFTNTEFFGVRSSNLKRPISASIWFQEDITSSNIKYAQEFIYGKIQNMLHGMCESNYTIHPLQAIKKLRKLL